MVGLKKLLAGMKRVDLLVGEGWLGCLMADYKACLVFRLFAGAAHRMNDRGVRAMTVLLCLHMMHANYSVGQA